MKRTGLLHLYYGDGKGKTTAAMGLALRAMGSGKRVVILQFPCAACFVQNQQVGRGGHGRCEVRILQLAGGFLFRFVHLEHEFLPRLAAVHLCTQLFQQRHLAAFAAFEELQDTGCMSEKRKNRDGVFFILHLAH